MRRYIAFVTIVAAMAGCNTLAVTETRTAFDDQGREITITTETVTRTVNVDAINSSAALIDRLAQLYMELEEAEREGDAAAAAARQAQIDALLGRLAMLRTSEVQSGLAAP